MLKILYVLSMAVAFSMEVNTVSLPYFLKYGIAIAWIIISVIKSGWIIKREDFNTIKIFSIPIIIAFFYTLIIWLVNPPEYLTFKYLSRLISNLGCMLVIVVCVIMVCRLFGKSVIKLSFWALFLTIGFNFIIVLQEYGFSSITIYLRNVFSMGQFSYGSTISNISYALEVHDATFAMGIFLIYFIFYYESERKDKLIYILCSLTGSYLGFKRNALIAILVSSILALSFIRKKSHNFIKTSQILGFVMFIVGMLYVALIKDIDVLPSFVKILDIARINLYHFLSGEFTISPFYFGKGFSYINNRLGLESELLHTSHTDFVRIYIEMGIYGFALWIWYYFVKLPRKLYTKYSVIAAKFFLIATFYVFSTYFLDNTLTLFDNQFIYYLIPLAMCNQDTELNSMFQEPEKKSRRDNK